MNITIGGQDFTGIDEGCDTTNTTAFIWWSTWWVQAHRPAMTSHGEADLHDALCGALQPSVVPSPAASYLPAMDEQGFESPAPSRFEFFLLILLSVAECGRVQGLFLTKQASR